MISRSTFFVLMLAACASLGAQDDTFVCNGLLRHGVYDKFRETTSAATASTFASHLCQAYQKLQKDKSGGSVSASYGLAGGEGSYSREQLEYLGQFMCSDTFSQASASQALSIVQDAISPTAMDAYRECVRQNSGGLKTNTTFREEDQAQMTLELRYVAPVGAPPQTTIRDIAITPSGAFVCSGPMWSLKGKENGVGTSLVSMSCARNVNSVPFDYQGRRVLATPSTITVMTDAGNITRSMTAITAVPPPTPLHIPVGTIIAFSGTMADAQDQQRHGWWICDGRSVQDPLAGPYHGKQTPNLSDRFLRGSATVANIAGGKSHHDIAPARVKVWVTGWDDQRAAVTDPRLGIWNSQTWVQTSPLISEGTLPGISVPTIPPFHTVLYLVKVK